MPAHDKDTIQSVALVHEDRHKKECVGAAEIDSWAREFWLFGFIKRMYWVEELRLQTLMKTITETIPQTVLDTKIGTLLDAAADPNIDASTRQALWECLSWCRQVFPSPQSDGSSFTETPIAIEQQNKRMRMSTASPF